MIIMTRLSVVEFLKRLAKELAVFKQAGFITDTTVDTICQADVTKIKKYVYHYNESVKLSPSLQDIPICQVIKVIPDADIKPSPTQENIVEVYATVAEYEGELPEFSFLTSEGKQADLVCSSQVCLILLRFLLCLLLTLM